METREDVNGWITQLLAQRMGMPARQIKRGARLVDDLEMDALDFVEVALELERDFGVVVGGDSLARLATVDDLVDLVCGLLLITEPWDYEADADDNTRPYRKERHSMADTQAIERGGQIASLATIDTRDWFAWNNVQPDGPARFHVTADVHVPNPGVDPLLEPRVPPGPSPTILLLDLILRQAPGMWPQVFVWAPTRYDEIPGYFRRVQIFFGGAVIADVPVQDIH